MHKHEKKLEDDRDEADSSVGDKKKWLVTNSFV